MFKIKVIKVKDPPNNINNLNKYFKYKASGEIFKIIKINNSKFIAAWIGRDGILMTTREDGCSFNPFESGDYFYIDENDEDIPEALKVFFYNV